MASGESKFERLSYRLIAVLLLAVFGVVASGYFFFVSQKRSITLQAEKELLAVAQLQANQIKHWRDEQLEDGQIMMRDPLTTGLIKDYLETSDFPQLKKDLARWLASLNDKYKGVFLLDTAGGTVLSVSGEEDATAYDRKLAGEAMRRRTVLMSDFVRQEDESTHKTHIDLAVPLISPARDEVRVLAVLMLEIDPNDFLFPLMRSWPMLGDTGETLLVRRDGDDILYLNKLRFRQDAAHPLRLPLASRGLLSAAALQGKIGVLLGRDYRNVPVIAAAEPISNSPWVLIAKMDVGEVSTPVSKQALYIGSIVILLIGLSWMSFYAWWRRQRMENYRIRYEGQSERLALLERFERLSKYANDIIVEFDVSGKIIEANDRAFAAYGYSREELLGRNVSDISTASGFDVMHSGTDESKYEGVIFEAVHRRKDGSTFPVEMSSRIITFGDREIVLSIVRDITERREAEKKIARANRLYSVLSRISETIVRTADRDSLFEKVCRIVVEFGGFGLAWIGIVDREGNLLRPAFHCGEGGGELEDISLCGDAEGCAALCRAVKKGSYFVSNDVQADPRMVQWREEALAQGYRSFGSFPIKIQGSVAGTLNVYSAETGFFDSEEIKLLEEIADDIAFALEDIKREGERRRFEDALAESEANYKVLVNNAPVGIYKTTLDGRFLFANEACARIFGFESAEELISAGVLNLYERPADREAFLDLLKERGSLINYELNLVTKDGEHRKILITAVLEEDVLSGMLLDVTEARKLEEQLRLAQKIEAVGLLAGGVSHDFNNILSAIIGYGQLLEMKMRPDDPLQSNVQEILSAARRGAVVTKGLLAFSRKQVFNLRPIDLNVAIRNVERLLARIIGEDIELRTVLHGDLTVIADLSQLEQVLMNLATNARDAMPEGGILTIASEPVVLDDQYIESHGYGQPGEYALVTVSDTGIGMSDETKARIFEPFFTTKEVGRGTGLGLAMAYGVVKQHNGIINVYSEEGCGTVFRIYLPLVHAEVETGERPADPRPPMGRGSETLLVAEDNQVVRKLSAAVLSEFGYTVIEAQDGEDAVRQFAENRERVSLAILDVIMPKKNGRAAYEEISKMQPGTKVLFVSGYTADVTQKRGLLLEGLDFITKPVSPYDLLAKVREILDRTTG